jgi:hypothetical protein
MKLLLLLLLAASAFAQTGPSYYLLWGGGPWGSGDCLTLDARGRAISTGSACGSGGGGGGTTETAANIGDGQGWYKQKVGTSIQFYSFAVTAPVVSALASDKVTFSCPTCLVSSATYSNPSFLTSLHWDKVTSVPKTGAGTNLASVSGAPGDGCAQWSTGNLVSTGLACGSGGSGVPTSRTISTSSPITGGGDLSTDRTFACATCLVDTASYGNPSWLTSVAWGKLTSVPSTFTPSTHVHAAADVTTGTFANALVAAGNVTQHQAALSIGWAQVTGVPSYIPTSRLLNTTAPITGGGDMSLDRTFGCATCVVTTASYSAPSWLTGLQPTSAKDAANGYAGLTAGGVLNQSQGAEVWTLANLSNVTAQRGDATVVQMAGAGTPATNDCAKFDAAGNLVSAGAACSSSTANPTVSFTSQTSVTFTHNLNTLNVLIQCYDGSDNLIAQNGHQLTSVNAATVTFSAAQTGRCVANGTGGSGGGGATDLISLTDVTATRGGASTIVQMAGAGTPAENDCAKFDASGGLVSAGAACGAGGSGTPGGSSGQIQYNNAGAFGGLALGFGLRSAAGYLEVNPSTVPTYLAATAALDFGSISASACSELTITLTGAAVGDAVIPSYPNAIDAGLLGNMFVSATNTVTVRLCKITTGSVDPASANFTATVVRSF